MTLSWHLPWCKGTGCPCSLWPELGYSHRGKILMTYHSLCTKLALSFYCYQLEGREEELKCDERRGIFRLMIDAPAVKGRWQSAEQHLGVSRTRRREIKFPLRCRCTWLAIPHFPFPFLSRQHILSHPVYSFSNNSRPTVRLYCCISLLYNEIGVSEPCDELGHEVGLSVSSL